MRAIIEDWPVAMNCGNYTVSRCSRDETQTLYTNILLSSDSLQQRFHPGGRDSPRDHEDISGGSQPATRTFCIHVETWITKIPDVNLAIN